MRSIWHSMVLVAIGSTVNKGVVLAQQAPMALPEVRKATIVFKTSANSAQRKTVRDAVRRLLRGGSVPNRTRISAIVPSGVAPERALFSRLLSTTAEEDDGSNTDEKPEGPQIGVSAGQEEGGKTTAGIVPSYQFNGNGYSLLVGLNATGSKTFGKDPSATDPASAPGDFGSALLNPGSSTQSLNFILFSEIRGKKGTLAAKPNVTSVPQAPTGLKAIAGNAQVILSWEASKDATGYSVYRGTATAAQEATPLATTATPTYRDTTVANGTTYFYTVVATNNKGLSQPSSEVSATPSEQVGPSFSLSGVPQNAAALAEATASLEGAGEDDP